MALAGALMEFIENKRRARPQTADLIEREFRPAAVWTRFHDAYSRAIDLEAARLS